MSGVAAARAQATDVAEFAEAIERRFGHATDSRRLGDLGMLLEARLRAAGAAGYAQYRNLLEQPRGAEWIALAPLLTVPETYFFRMPEHFEALAQDALPEVLRRNRDRKTLRLLSAGCASGEEAYSLRILLDERFPQLRDWQVTIVGVDLSEPALERARAAEYSAWALRATSEARRVANFTQAGKMFRLKPKAQAGVLFRHENLLAPAPAVEADAPYDVIFCRNVLIYFSEAAMREAVERLMGRLAEQGYLFLGPAESLRGLSRDFSLCHRHDTFFYRLKAGVRAGEIAARATVRMSPGHASAPAPAASEPVDYTWFESIRNSSERLTGLVETPVRKPASARPKPKPAAQSKPIASLTLKPPPRFLDLVAGEQFAQALALLDTAPRQDVDAEATRLLRASMLTNLGRHQEAEVECHALLAVDDMNAGAHFLLGLCREQAGQLAEAAEQMSTATYLDPAFPMAHLHRALIARRRGDKAAAIESFRLALEAVEGEDEVRLQLFGGGFSREGLRQVCVKELARLGPASTPESTRDTSAKGPS